jgi:transposase
MLPVALQNKTIDNEVLDYINAIKTNYEQQIKTLASNVKEYQFKYDELKERYDLLIYKRFARSAEQLLKDEKQQLLFNSEAGSEEAAANAEEEEKTTDVKSYKRKNAGRKPLDPNLPRSEPVIIDIPDSEKTCACGAKLTKIGEETAD